jgi:hypothetical protein
MTQSTAQTLTENFYWVVAVTRGKVLEHSSWRRVHQFSYLEIDDTPSNPDEGRGFSSNSSYVVDAMSHDISSTVPNGRRA